MQTLCRHCADTRKLWFARPEFDSVHISITSQQDLHSTAQLRRSSVFLQMMDCTYRDLLITPSLTECIVLGFEVCLIRLYLVFIRGYVWCNLFWSWKAFQDHSAYRNGKPILWRLNFLFFLPDSGEFHGIEVRANLHFPPAVLYATQTKGMKNVTSSFETVFHRLVPSFQVPPCSATKSSASTLNTEFLYFHFISPAPSYFRENSNRCQHNIALPTIPTSLVLRKTEETSMY